MGYRFDITAIKKNLDFSDNRMLYGETEKINGELETDEFIIYMTQRDTGNMDIASTYTGRQYTVGKDLISIGGFNSGAGHKFTDELTDDIAEQVERGKNRVYEEDRQERYVERFDDTYSNDQLQKVLKGITKVLTVSQLEHLNDLMEEHTENE